MATARNAFQRTGTEEPVEVHDHIHCKTVQLDDRLYIGTTQVTSTAAELNYNDGVTPGTVTASKTIMAGASKDIDTIDITKDGLKIGGVAVTTTAAELNLLDTTTAGTVVASKAVAVGSKKDIDFLQFGSAATSVALLHGGGISGTPETTATAGKNFMGYWLESTATTGDCRGMYLRVDYGAAGSGEALRAWGKATAANVATGGTMNGAHITMSVDASATISGQAHAIRATLGYATDTRTTDANVAALCLDSDIGANNTVHANNAFMRLTNSGSVTLGKFLRTPTVASAGILAAHVTDSLSHSIRCVDDAGTVFYIMCTTDASNRTGGA